MILKSLAQPIRAGRVRPMHLLAVAGLMAMAACQPTPGTGAGQQTEVLRVVDSQTGTITGMQEVAMPASGLTRAGGAFSGAVVGGLIGNQFGRGGGNTVMTAVGALGGAAAGDAMAQSMNQQRIPQWTVRLDDGRTVSVISNASGLQIGGRARVQQLSNGELRIGPL